MSKSDHMDKQVIRIGSPNGSMRSCLLAAFNLDLTSPSSVRSV